MVTKQDGLILYFLLLFVWLLAFAFSFADFYYCNRSFQASTLLWTVNCTKQSNNGGKFFLGFRYIWALIILIVIFAMYLAIFYFIRNRFTSVINGTQKTSKTSERRRSGMLETVKYERSIGGFGICLWQQLKLK
ncbi:Adenosine receptor [Dirofilaria immitis]